jgi:alkyl hydroperoxide reductase subunit D
MHAISSSTCRVSSPNAAAIMGMNNVYYRFTHLVSAEDYKTLPAKLRMNVMARPGVDKVDFELWSLAVSAINGCGMCMDSHEKVLRESGVEADAIQAAVRIAATVHAIAVTLESEVRLAA